MRARILGLAVALAMIAASCAGSGGDSPATELAVADTGTTDAPEEQDAPLAEVEVAPDAAENGSEDASEGLNFGRGTAVVTVADTRYEFVMGDDSSVGVSVCSNIGGAVQAVGYDVDGRAISVEMWIPPVDWDTYADERFNPPRIVIKDSESDGGWIADIAFQEANPDFYTAGSFQVDDYVNDGFRASGAATFLPREPWGSPAEGAQSVAGTFEVECAEQ